MGCSKVMMNSGHYVCVWALFSACCITGIVVHIFTHQGEHPVPAASPASSSSSSSRWASCVNLTDVEDLAASAVLGGLLWLSAPQATAAALALLLPPGPRRRALAFVAHAGKTASHYLSATLFGLLPAPGRNNRTVALIFLCGVLDVLGFLALLSEEEEAAE